MRRIGSWIGTAAVAAAIVLFASTAFAFHIRIGSYYFGFPLHWHHHHHHHHFVARGRPVAPAPQTQPQVQVPAQVPAQTPAQTPAQPTVQPPEHPAVARGTASPLFYPQLALSDVLVNVFTSSSAWPFDYQSILSAAFTKPESPNAQLCESQPNLADRFLAPVDTALELTVAQAQLLNRLGGALDTAQNSLMSACPNALPAAPLARLALMDSQIVELAAALGGVRPSLQDFQHELTDEQLARLAAMIAAPTANNKGSQPGCGGGNASAATDRVTSLINQAVAPTAAQRDALNAFKEALGNAARDLQADCAAPMPPTELGRLSLIKTRLDTTGRAVRLIAAALTIFKAALSEEQKARLDAASLAAQ